MAENSRTWTKFGRYALLQKIGAGGMAEIYRAKTFGAAGFEKEFAIKMILPSLVDDKEFVEMFINEAKIAVSLYHANIVQVFDLGELDDQYYIAMEFVHGKDLLDVLARCTELKIKIPLEIVLFVVMEMLKGLDFAHRAKDSFGDDLNIIHRDVSPSNLLLSYAGDVKVGDFGVAKAAVQRTLTESGTLKGKVSYMSPEQVMGGEIDARSDLFSAAIVFFEALSMNRLFVGSSDLDVMLKVRDADYSEALKKAPPMPSDLVAIVARGLAKDREQRFQSAGEFYQALVDFCFQHSIKVTGSDLSNFLRRLFAKQIEEEKNRRRSEPSGAVLSREMVRRSRDEEAGGSRRAPISTGGPSATPARGSAILHRAHKQATTPPVIDDRGDSELGSAETDEKVHRRFRFRDQSGMVFGPMGERTLVDLCRMRRPSQEDRVSVEGGPWRRWEEISEVIGKVDMPGGSAGVARADQAELEPPPASEGSGVITGLHRPDRAGELAHSRTVLVPSLMLGEAITESSEEEEQRADLSSPVVRRAPSVAREAVGLVGDTIEELKGQYASYQGKLSQVSFARLLGRLHLAGGTGRLYVQSGETEKSIYFRHGEPIFVDSNRKEELLGNYLLARELITEEQLLQALHRLSEWGGRLGDALVAIGAVPAHHIFDHLAAQMEAKLLEIFSWDGGVYGYFEGQESQAQGYPLGLRTYRLIVEGCRSRVSIDRIRGAYEQRPLAEIGLAYPRPFSVNRLGLRGRELRVFHELQSGDTLRGLCAKFAPEHHEQVYRTLYLLHQVELIAFEGGTEVDLPPLPQG